ncbi:MAG: HAD domain-containing protein [Verrucomicrobiota bacterium]
MKQPPVIFLDFDGVIRMGDGTGPKSFKFIPDKLALIREFTDLVRGRLVVTSTWRELFKLERILEEMAGALTLEHFHSSWMTPLLRAQSRCDARDVPRGAEIITWLHSQPEVPAFVIFDDLPTRDFYPLHDHLVPCDSALGLIPSSIGLALRLLGKQGVKHDT